MIARERTTGAWVHCGNMARRIPIRIGVTSDARRIAERVAKIARLNAHQVLRLGAVRSVTRQTSVVRCGRSLGPGALIVRRVVAAAHELQLFGMAIRTDGGGLVAHEMVELCGVRIVAIETRRAVVIQLAQCLVARTTTGLMAGDALAQSIERVWFRRSSIAMEHVATAARPAGRCRHADAILFLRSVGAQVVIGVDDAIFVGMTRQAHLPIRQLLREHESFAFSVVQLVTGQADEFVAVAEARAHAFNGGFLFGVDDRK